jgi:hypothetical protein
MNKKHWKTISIATLAFSAMLITSACNKKEGSDQD